MRNSNKNNGNANFSDNSGAYQMRQGEHIMRNSPYHLSDKEESISELLYRVTEGIRRLFIAAKYQFHKRTFGIFRQVKTSWVKTTIIACSAYFLFFRGDDVAIGFRAPIAWMTGNEAGKESPINWASTVSMSGTTENPFAPASPSDLRDQQVKNYVKRFSKVAVAEMDKFGVPASIMMAQGIIESRCGSSILASKVNNHFGIKCFSKKCRKGHCTNFEDDFHKDFFKVYTSAWESWRDHSVLLSNGRYKVLLNEGKDYEAWAAGLKKLGYATDDDYDQKLIDIIKKYQLDQLDDL